MDKVHYIFQGDVAMWRGPVADHSKLTVFQVILNALEEVLHKGKRPTYGRRHGIPQWDFGTHETKVYIHKSIGLEDGVVQPTVF
jgi:hypothetical protein